MDRYDGRIHLADTKAGVMQFPDGAGYQGCGTGSGTNNGDFLLAAYIRYL
jgi:hypothetical protein